MQVTYNPAVFNVPDVDAARRIILTEEPNASTDERWIRETPYVAALITRELEPGPDSLILDFGCGIGRVAKELIARTGCRVLGVDISPQMRRMAIEYVDSDRFEVTDPGDLDMRVRQGLRVDGAVAVWVIQHCLEADSTVRFLREAMAPLARLFVLNTIHRCVPAIEKPWANDGADVNGLLRQHLEEIAGGSPDPAGVGARAATATFWGTYRRRGAARG